MSILKVEVKVSAPKNWNGNIAETVGDRELKLLVKKVLSRVLIVLPFALDWGKTQPTIKV